jgi:hypothetical protein
MNIKENITKHEMARRFAMGEVRSQFFFSQEEENKEETLHFLNSDNFNFERLGIQRHWKSRGNFVNSLPEDTEWSLAKLRLSEDEFVRLHTVNVDGWVSYTSGSLRLVDAAFFLQANPERDPRVSAIISACNQGQLEICGITLLGRTIEGPFTIVEGTARLVALYLNCVQKNTSPLCMEEIEVVLGLSHSNWHFS